MPVCNWCLLDMAKTYDYLEMTDVDWWNNSGGQGELVIDMGNQLIELKVDVNYTQVETEFQSETDFEELVVPAHNDS